MADEKTTPTITSPVKTVGDMMAALEQHIQDSLSGRMTESTARTVIKFRNAQLKTAEMQLQYARIFKGRTPDPVMRLIPAAETPGVSRLTPEEQATLDALQRKAAG